MEQQETVEYIKTIREIADEIGVSKQAVFKKINRQPLSTELMGLTATVGGRLMVSVEGERLIKRTFSADNAGLNRQPSTVNHQPSTVNHQPSTVNRQPSTVNRQPSTVNRQPSTVNHVDGRIVGCAIENARENLDESVQKEDYGEKNEIDFLRQQIEIMNNQMLQRDAMIESINKELEKEREHNREKDRQLLDTLSKLAETQVALAAGQNAEKQKALAETLIDGQQMIEKDRRETLEVTENDFEDEFRDEPKKHGFWQRIWAAIANK